MTLAEMLPTLDDGALATLKINANRLSAGPEGKRQTDADALLPLIEAELAARHARLPPKATKPKRAKAAPRVSA